MRYLEMSRLCFANVRTKRSQTTPLDSKLGHMVKRWTAKNPSHGSEAGLKLKNRIAKVSLMCGRYEAGKKQKSQAFHVSVTLDDIYFGAGLECAPGSIQPVIYIKGGERQVGEMRWGFKLPDRLLFNARSDTVTTAPFWRERLHNRCIVPAGSFFEWKKTAPLEEHKRRKSRRVRRWLFIRGRWFYTRMIA